MEDKDREQKLKELEKTLAEELEPAESPAPTEGQPAETPQAMPAASSNPPSDAAASAPATSSSNGEESAISPEEFDALLREEDPEFEKELAQIQADIQASAADLEISTLDLEGELPAKEEIADAVPELKPESKKGMIHRFFAAIASVPARINDFRKNGLKTTIQNLKQALPRLTANLKSKTADGIQVLRASLRAAISTPLRTKFQFLLLISVLAVSALLIKGLLTGQVLSFAEKEDFLPSFDKVATTTVEFAKDSPMEDFRSPLRHPEHIVLLKKMIVNLKPSENSGTTPMAAFELYVETSNREAAIEIKDREKQIIDVVSRVAESLPYDDLQEITGKEKFKMVLRREINQMLNSGRVQKVYFKTLFSKR